MSYGGSSLLANYILLAILARISHGARRPRTRPRNKSPDTAAGTEVIGNAQANASLRRISVTVMALIVLLLPNARP